MSSTPKRATKSRLIKDQISEQYQQYKKLERMINDVHMTIVVFPIVAFLFGLLIGAII